MRHKPLRLRTKITLSFVVLFVLWSTFVLGLLDVILSRGARRFFRDRGTQLVRVVATESTPLVQYEEKLGLDRLFRRYMDSFPELRYIVVLDAGGDPILSSFPGGMPGDLARVRHRFEPGGDVSVRLIRAGGELLYDYECRRAALRVRIGMSLQPVQQLVQSTIRYVLGLGAVGFLAVFAVALRISRPVESLTRAIEQLVEMGEKLRGVSGGGTLETRTIAERFRQLVARLDERTRQLDASKKLAYLGELSASIAHEVNNPLGVIVINASFLEKRRAAGQLSPEASREVERLSAAAKRATLAVQKLLQFARHATGRTRVRHQRVRLDALVHETLDLLRDRLGVAECTVQVDLPEDLHPVSCDAQGIQQVLFNLIANAIDASPKGGEILVKATADSQRVRMAVSDQGPGMSPEVARRAKEPFFSTKGPERGTGLGLAISEAIVEGHGGTLAMESCPGQGTTVTVELPAPGRGKREHGSGRSCRSPNQAAPQTEPRPS